MPRDPVETRDTKERILDSAEHLFADHGFADTSLRSITADAEVNLAAVNYHFGSKEMLIQAVLSRRLEPLNRERLELLDRFEAEAGEGGPAAEHIVEAFIGPPLRMSRDPRRGGWVFVRLLGHAMNSPNEQIRNILFDQLREVVRRFVAALRRVSPELPEEETYWRLVFMAGSMAHTMVMSKQLESMSGGLCDASDVEGLLRRLVTFLSAGLRVPASVVGTGGAS